MRSNSPIPKAELVAFVQEHRVEKGLTWAECAKVAYKKYGIKSSTTGKPYVAGVGFQDLVHRITGQQKWGRQMQPFEKGGFEKKTSTIKGEKPKSALKPAIEKPQDAPKPITEEPKVAQKMPDTAGDLLDLMQDVLGSNMQSNTKVTLIKSLAATLK